MAKQYEIYKCMLCGNLVEVLFAGVSNPECCGQPMKLMLEGTSDGSAEKHVPVIEKTATGFKVKVGSVAHPMEEKHWIQWIELLADDFSYIKYLKPGEAPVAEFQVEANKVAAREYCNLHGLWKVEL